MGQWEEAGAHAGQGQDLEVVGPSERKLRERSGDGTGLTESEAGNGQTDSLGWSGVQRDWRGGLQGERGEGTEGRDTYW